MAASSGLILLLMLCCCSNTAFAEDYDDLDDEDYEDLEAQLSWISKFSDGHKEDENGKALSYPGCGFRTPKIQGNSKQTRSSRTGGTGLMVGGSEAKENSWPWMVAMYTTGKDDWHITKPFHCGASLISRKYVLSAAHCFAGTGRNNTDPSKWSVVVGAHSLSDGTKYPVSRILIHEDYMNASHVYHDIALVEFEKPIELSETVYPVCLPSSGLTDKIETNRSEVIATGWGQIAHDGWLSDVLMEIEQHSIPLERCNDFWTVWKGQICTNGTAKKIGICGGDSGGPVVYEMEDHSYVQVGIVSYGAKCAAPRWPAVYTRVSQYLKWIYDNSDLGQ